jgi:hypothetical protein
MTYDANLGAGGDYFFFLHDAQNVLHSDASLTVNVEGGLGNDRLIARKDAAFPGGFITLDENATFEMNLFGGAGKDQLLAFFDDSLSSTTLQIDANAVFRLQLDGGLDNDRVSASLENDASLFTSSMGIYDVGLFGGPGRDFMGLRITDPVPLTYVNGKALLDGGAGIDAIELLVGVNGMVQKLNIP